MTLKCQCRKSDTKVTQSCLESASSKLSAPSCPVERSLNIMLANNLMRYCFSFFNINEFSKILNYVNVNLNHCLVKSPFPSLYTGCSGKIVFFSQFTATHPSPTYRWFGHFLSDQMQPNVATIFA